MRSKRILAVILATILVMIPVSASARTHRLAITGIYDGYRHNYIVVDVNGSPHVFYPDENSRFYNSYYHPGDEVRIVVDAADPATIISMRITKVNYTPPKVEHDAYSITGTVSDYDGDTITIMYGRHERIFRCDSADILHSPDGIEEGDIVKVVYAPNNSRTALQLIMIQHGENHEEHGHPMHRQEYKNVTGNIVDAGMNSITIFVQGQYMTFGKEDAQVASDDGISIGDVVRIYFDPDNPNDAVRIQMIRKA